MRPLPGVVGTIKTGGFDSSAERRIAIAQSSKPIATVMDFVGNAGCGMAVRRGRCGAGSIRPSVVNFACEKRSLDQAGCLFRAFPWRVQFPADRVQAPIDRIKRRSFLRCWHH
jgi:hypothetical protein